MEIRLDPSWTLEERKAYILDLVRMSGDGGGPEIDFSILDKDCEEKAPKRPNE